MSKVITFFHESFIHVDLYTQDFLDNGKFDYSNIPREVKEYTNFYMGKSNATQQYHHEYVKSDINKSILCPSAASRGIIEVNSSLGLKYKDQNIQTMMWNFNGGKKSN
jgi:hypothetical protein